MPIALVTAVKTDHVAGQQSPHDSCQRNFACTQKKVSMILKKCPGIASRLCFQQKVSHPSKKILSIAIIPKNLSAFNAPDDNMVKNSRSIKTS
jgi:hypothetical protein